MVVLRLSTGQLSQARRNLGAVSVGGFAYFVGGCTNQGTDPDTQFICDDASDAIDKLDSNGKLVHSYTLSSAKGWVSTCAAGDSRVVMAGGGKKGTLPHSRSADVLDVRTGSISTDATALSAGAWGVPCATIANSTFFLGGKVTISGYDNAYTSPVINIYTAGAGWQVAPYTLSRGRESAAALVLGGKLVSAGGWCKNATLCEPKSKYCGDDSVDIFSAPLSTGGLKTSHLKSPAYDAGVAVVGDRGYIVGDSALYIIASSGDIKTEPLPADMQGPGGAITGGGAIPRSHIPQNGAVVGKMACFCGSSPCVLYCYNTASSKWARSNCSTEHAGGSIVAVGNKVMVGGGFDPKSATFMPTAVVDIFDLSEHIVTKADPVVVVV